MLRDSGTDSGCLLRILFRDEHMLLLMRKRRVLLMLFGDSYRGYCGCCAHPTVTEDADDTVGVC